MSDTAYGTYWKHCGAGLPPTITAFPERFAGVIAANTGLPTGEGTPPEAFLAWQKFSQTVPEFPVGNIINGATVTELP